jgi:hypothetical protein
MNKSILSYAFLAALFLTPLSTAIAQTCSKQSPSHTVALLELYTSEGCSSCPPADKFVSNLRTAGLLADQIVPLSLHVDYWDYIGWKDMFAKRIYTERQRWLSELANTRTIYTPEMFVSGKEMRDWAISWRGGIAGMVKRINALPAQADIGIVLRSITNGSLPVEIIAKAPAGSKLFVALYETDLISEVKAGENQGATLKHDYVVRDWSGPVALSSGGTGGRTAWSRAISLPVEAPRKNLGVAAFIQTDAGDVLQAISLPLCN